MRSRLLFNWLFHHDWFTTFGCCLEMHSQLPFKFMDMESTNGHGWHAAPVKELNPGVVLQENWEH
jgi:hypothetical protein